MNASVVSPDWSTSPPLGETAASLKRGLPVLLALTCAMIARTASECRNALAFIHVSSPWTPILLFAGLVWFWWMGIAILLWLTGARHPQILRISTFSILAHLAAGSVFAAAHMALLREFVVVGALRWSAWSQAYITRGCITGERFGADLAIYCVLFLLCTAVHHQLASRWALVQKLAIERQFSDAQLQALRRQIEPHFLFNALNAVASLIDLGRNAEAGEAVTHLNLILRTTLRRNSPEKIPFSEELRVVESYLAIQQVRFADRLQVHFDTAPAALNGLVPSFLLQPIVENAIHHGIAPLETGGMIETSVKRVGDMLWLQVRDNGAGTESPAKSGHGIGLRNIRERLNLLYPNKHTFQAGQRAAGGFEVTIQIPFECRAV